MFATRLFIIRPLRDAIGEINKMRDERILYTSTGNFPLYEYLLETDGQEWKILHVGAVMSQDEESNFLLKMRDVLPYGVALWAASLALAYEIASRSSDFRDKQILELGAGTGLPGIVAASQKAQVVQTDRDQLVTSLCKRNIALNKIETINQRIVDWKEWKDVEKYDWIIGSDILYAEENHAPLRKIFENNLTPGGRILLSDPFRESSISFLETLESEGWSIIMSKWSVGEDSAARPVGVFELTSPT